MADGIIQVPPDSTGKKVDAASLDVGLNSVIRQRIVIADNSATGEFVAVSGGALNVFGTVNISATAQVAIASPITVNSISRTAIVTGVVLLGNNSANIGFIDAISKTVEVAISTPFTINNISATTEVLLVAGTANIGAVSLGAGTANIGFINSISKTVEIAVSTPFTVNNISATVSTILSHVVEKTSGSLVQVGDSANAAIRVNIVSGGGTGGTAQNDRTTFTEAATALTPAGGVFSDTRSAVAEDVVAALRITNQAGLHANLRTDGGTAMDDSANSALRVSVVSGGGTGGTSQNDRTSFVEATSPLNPIGGVYSDTRSAVAEDKVAALRITEQAGLHVNLRDSSGNQLGDTSATGVFIRTATVAISGGNLAISGTVIVAVSTPFTLNNISATVNTVVGAGTALIGAVSLAAGTSNIGFINNISATVNVAFAGGISLAAGTANIGFLNNISATVQVAGNVNISATASVLLAAGTANIGSINNISATVTVTTSNPYILDVRSTSHGPQMVQVSTSAATTLIANPGAGNSIFVTQLVVTNAGTANTLFRMGTSASSTAMAAYCQSAGGGFVMNFDPPWKFPASEQAVCSVKPNASGNVYVNVNFFVAST